MPCNGYSHNERYHERGAEGAKHQPEDLARCAAHDFTYAHLLLALTNEEERHADEAKHGDDDGHECKERDDAKRVTMGVEGFGNHILGTIDNPGQRSLGTTQFPQHLDQFLLGFLVSIRLDKEGRIVQVVSHLDGERHQTLQDIDTMEILDDAGYRLCRSVAPGHLSVVFGQSPPTHGLLVEVITVTDGTIIPKNLQSVEVEGCLIQICQEYVDRLLIDVDGTCAGRIPNEIGALEIADSFDKRHVLQLASDRLFLFLGRTDETNVLVVEAEGRMDQMVQLEPDDKG